MSLAVNYLILLLKSLGILITTIAAFHLFYDYIKQQLSEPGKPLLPFRIKYVRALLLAFEVLLAGGVLVTTLNPSWGDIGKLAAIATIRTFIKKVLTLTLKNYLVKHNN
jgi:uncharacterized membrane protein